MNPRLRRWLQAAYAILGVIGAFVLALAIGAALGYGWGHSDGWHEGVFFSECVDMLARDPNEPGCQDVAAKLDAP